MIVAEHISKRKSDMILVDEVTRASIEEVVRHLGEEEPFKFERAFMKIDGED